MATKSRFDETYVLQRKYPHGWVDTVRLPVGALTLVEMRMQLDRLARSAVLARIIKRTEEVIDGQ